MFKLIHQLLYRTLSLHNYLRVVSRMFFVWQRLGLGRHAAATEYVYHLEKLVRKNDTVIDIGANLGYYTRTLSRLVGQSGKVYAVEPMPPVLEVLRHNVRHCENVEILPYALGCADQKIAMANDSARTDGYLGTGQNFVNETGEHGDVEFEAEMRRGSELFGSLRRLNFVKCDIEGYELNVMREMQPVIDRHHPVVLIETGGDNRRQIIDLFTRMGYRGYTLYKGEELPLASEDKKDIIFRYAN